MRQPKPFVSYPLSLARGNMSYYLILLVSITIMMTMMTLVESSLSSSDTMTTAAGAQQGQGQGQDNELDHNTAQHVINATTKLPMVGVGVGNLRRHLVDSVLMSSFDMGYLLVDTARASRNEALIAKTISEYIPLQEDGGASNSRDNSNHELNNIHVITKVWYTHLGYERTKISVQESMEEIVSGVLQSSRRMDETEPSAVLRVHVLLHWPRCNDRIEWMRCQEEEDALPQYVKDAGPPPHLDKENAWKGSWRALEDLYLEQQQKQPQQQTQPQQVVIESVGVSNFELQDMKTLLKECRVKPSMYQGNVWIVLHNPNLYNVLRENGILFQAYNVMNGILKRRNDAPNAFSVLTRIGKQLDTRATMQGEENNRITEAMVVMAWLVQEGISVVPRASSYQHRLENSPSSIASVPSLTREEKEQVRSAMSALMRGEDVKIEATFQNNLSTPVKIQWRNSQTGKEVAVMQSLESGKMSTIQTHPGHVFVAYNDDKNQGNMILRKEFKVTVNYGERQYFTIDGDDEL